MSKQRDIEAPEIPDRHRENAFAAHLASGLSPLEAYKRAFGKASTKEANRLASDPYVMGEARRLAEGARKRAEVDLASHLKRLGELSEVAQGLGQVSAAVRAEELRGRVAGLYIEKTETIQSVSNMSLNDVKEALAKALADPVLADVVKAALGTETKEEERHPDTEDRPNLLN